MIQIQHSFKKLISIGVLCLMVSFWGSMAFGQTISTVSPVRAAATATVTLTGSGFVAGTTVKFGSVTVSGSNVNVTNSSSLTVIVPSSGLSVGTIYSMTVGTGTAKTNAFTFLATPTLTLAYFTGTSAFTPLSGTPFVSGSPSIGNSITINGTGFSPTGGSTVSSVTIGGASVSSFTSVSATQIVVPVPSAASGTSTIQVVAAGITLTTANTFATTTITGFTPTSAGQDSLITITGTNLSSASSVKFGTSSTGTVGTTATIQSNTSTQIIAKVAAGTTTGSGFISVTNAVGTTTKSGFTFLNIPTITSFTPTSAGKDSTVVINGTNFTGVSGASSVSFGGTNAVSYVVNSATQITAVVAAGTSGSVKVINTDGTATKSGFTFLNIPTITSFTPTSAGKDSTVVITGTNFTSVSGASSVSFGGTNATSYVVNSATQITAVVASGTSGSVKVINTDGTATKSGFTFLNIPTITSFTPTSAGKDSTVVITGTNFTSVSGASSVSFGGTNATSYVVNSATQITAVVAAGTSGSVMVINTDGTATKSGFTFLNIPTITSFTPTSAGTDSTVVITGTNFTGVTGASSVTFGGTNAQSYVVNSNTQITAVVAAGTSGSVKVINTDGTANKSGFVFLPSPTISSFTPTSAGTDSTVVITGTNFTGVTGIFFGGTAAKSYLVNSTTQITAVVNTGTNGSVSVVTSGGTGTKAGFTYLPSPTISSISPGYGYSSSSVVITGTDFTNVTSVYFGGTAATSFTVNSATQITATVGSGTTGDVTVVTSGGTGVLSSAFTFLSAPTITSFTPTSAGTGATVTISGTDFMFGTDTLVTAVSFGGIAATSYTVVDANTITAVVAVGASGSVTVTTFGGSASQAGFTYLLLPAITSTSSSTAYAGDVLTITGTNFTGVTDVQFGGISASFTFVSGTSITTTVPTGLVGSIGLTVITPAGTSVPYSITINNKWTGAGTSDWNDATSWSAGSVPVTELAYIPSGLVTNPVLSADTYVNDLILNGTISLNGNTFYLEVSLTGTGTFIGSTSSNLQMDGTGTVYFDPSNNKLQYFTVNNNVTLGNALDVYGVLYCFAGTFTTGGHLTLKNTSASQVAKVGPVSGTISGTVTTERYITQHTFRPFVDVCPMVANAGTVLNNWQEGGVNNNGYGVQITGIKGIYVTIDNGTGFDVSAAGNGSMQTYTDTGWGYIKNTNALNLDPAQGYRLLARGNRSFSLYTTPQPTGMNSDVTLRTTGNLVTGDVTYTTSGVSSTGGFSSSYHLKSTTNAFNFIGNPYVSTVSWSQILTGSSGIDYYYYFLDPNVRDGSNASTYISYLDDGTGSSTGTNSNGSSAISDDIQPGQAIFVHQTGTSPQIVIPESAKTVGNSPTQIFGIKTPTNKLNVNLWKGGRSIDGAVSVFKTGYTNKLGKGDCPKLLNTGENLTFLKGTSTLSITSFGLPTATDTIKLQLSKMVAKTAYQLKLNANVFNGNGMNAFVSDKYLKSVTKVNSDSTIINFTTTTDSATYFNRFSIYFAPSTLPVSLISLTASETNDHQAKLTWAASTSNNIAYYTIQRSLNGHDFVNIATVSSSTNAYTDYSSSSNSQVYYRIKAISNNDAASFSEAVSINIAVKNNILSVYPNPVVGSTFNVELDYLNAAKYTLQLFNSLGQKVVSREFIHGGGKLMKSVSTEKMSAGIYTLKLISLNGENYQSSISFK